MQRLKLTKILSIVLTVLLILSVLPVSAFAENTDISDDSEKAEVDVAMETEDSEDETLDAISVEVISQYSDFLLALTKLEEYADTFAREHSGEDAIALTINYIRCGIEKYTSGTWTTFCGPENTAFTSYVTEQDEANGTSASRLRKLNTFTLPNGNEVDFGHMFGCLDMAYHTGNQNTADLGSWAGDICDLLQLTSNAGVTGTVEEMAEEIRTNNDEYFLYDDPNAHSFGILDLYGDLDSFYILKQMDGSKTISAIMRSYYTQNLTDSARAKFFLSNRFDGASTKDAIRNAVYETYCANEGIRTLEGTYISNGVNTDLRRACCYAFADYLYETAKDQLGNAYFEVFSSSSSVLAPGITQEIKMAMTQDDKQIVYYLATADITRSDVNVYANYGDNDGSVWKMARVKDQMNAAQQKHSDPVDTENYIPNYNAVVGVNADFYNMSTGCPSGALVMGGIEYHGVGNENFFGILKDGTPIIGGSAEWNTYKDEIQEAVGADVWLVKDGKIAVSATENYYSSRASRTCVGITYDGKVVLMVLDGRQEPFSAGGSAIEIAQIMFDAGCVSAVNLDGGGSSTFAAREEGSSEISVVNRPSDGYERSVSSSLLVVSTAKPSNVFDHALILADYDYLTIGTELAVTASGVTATGGKIDLPEDVELKVSDESIGTFEDGVFTALSLGNVQIQLVAADGSVLGSKTLHVVEPTDLKFTKESINSVYGVSTELPLEASYNEKPVKINPNDVQFGYLKITLQSIGEVEGGTVNTTKTELVFDYPEAGTITDFSFTPNAESELRILTIGAVLKSKLGEFQETINQEYMKAYQEAKTNGYGDEEAALQAQAAAINKALESATKITAYMYRSDEANFDFNQATGSTGQLAWRREVSNAVYRDDEQVYSLIDSSADTKVTYTFAVDMSKIPIPEKLTALLYMLPGGDQEGRTAWDFLLQLAERISPLTSVTITVTIPDGFTVDTKSELRLSNEYFTLSSTELVDNELIIICNFIEQSEPINPTTANPLCVLSGLKLIPTEDDAAWDENGRLACTISGNLSYDIYAHFHVLMTLAQQEEYQQKYGLFPYDNRENDPNDYGAHFANDIGSFTDSFNLQKNTKEGWVRENGAWSYYQNGAALTGIQKLPSFVDGESGEFWYDFGANGVCTGKLTGVFEKAGEHYYARFGKLVSGWQSLVADDGKSYFYYFDKLDFTMYTGVRTIDTLTYTFNEDGQLIRGAFRKDANGTKYFVAGESWFRRFVTLEEGTYWLNVNGYVAFGNAYTVTDNVKDITWYHFDEETGLLTGLCNGFIDYCGERYYCDENGKVFYGLIKVGDEIIFTGTHGLVYVNRSCYVDSSTAAKGCSLETGKYWCNENGYLVKNGFVDIDNTTYYFTEYARAKGFTKIGEDYYLFNASSGMMYKDATMWVNANSYGVEPGMHYFDADGKMFIPDLEHGEKKIVNENGKLYFTIDGVKMTDGLYKLDGEYYYAQSSGELAVNKSVYIETNLLSGTGWYGFDAESKLIKTGFVTGNGYTYYYADGVRAKGLTKIGEDYYLFNASSGMMYKDATMWVNANSYGVEPGMHYFDADGKMFIPDLEHGEKKIVNENGKLYFTIDGVKMTDGLYKLDGEYYYAQSSGELAVNKSVYTVTDLLSGTGWYGFDAEGKLIRTGFVTGKGYTYYYADGVRAKGLTKIGEDYYLFNASSGMMYKDATMWVNANSYGVEPGMHYFDADGKMTIR